MQEMLEAIQATPLAQEIRLNLWYFPSLEAAHIIAAAATMGCIAMLDLRLLWAVSRRRAVSAVSAEVLPLVWGAFVIAIITGALLFISDAARYGASMVFLIKMGLLVLAGLNMAAFHLLTARTMPEWDSGRPPAAAARLAGGLSLLLWTGVIVFGRWIGFA